jgi:ABC-type Fe3+ transport system substrate-binding protein
VTENTPRLIGRKQAAAYLDIAESTFSMWVASHKMPPPIPGTRKWDRKAIDTKLDDISGLTANDREDPYEKWMRENG